MRPIFSAILFAASVAAVSAGENGHEKAAANLKIVQPKLESLDASSALKWHETFTQEFHKKSAGVSPLSSFSGYSSTAIKSSVAFSGADTSASEANYSIVSANITNSASVTTNATLYHINPLSIPVAPVNMDLGDIAGDLVFDIYQILAIYACYDKPVAPFIICDNKETSGKDLGVTKVVLAVSEQNYGPYATCNICLNGSSPLNTSHLCTHGEYVCDCENGAFPPKKVPCTAAVGYENTSAYLGRTGTGKFCPLTRGHSKVAACAISTAADKLQGSWFSTLRQGEGVTWRLVEVVKRVRRDCHSNSFYTSVERRLPKCFAGCHGGAGASRNTSSLCWAGCFSDAALGPQARTSTHDLESGMTREELVGAWSRPFDSNDVANGGCPHV